MDVTHLILLSVAPAEPYFLWQYEVFFTNARKQGISSQVSVLLWYRDDHNLSPWHRLQEKYPECTLYFYKDEGAAIGIYLPVLRPHTLKKHFAVHGETLKDKVIFYHDSDILFRELPDFSFFMDGPVCWQSNTSGYLDTTYLTQKEVQGLLPPRTAVNKLAQIGGIAPETLFHYQGRTGGAQVFLKGIDASFWDDVERMCLEIYTAFAHRFPGSLNRKYFSSETAGFQSWCADMWALNLSLWKRGIPTDTHPELDFCWATSPYAQYLQTKIYHNAGSVGDNPQIFHKGSWIQKSPLYQTHTVSPQWASSAYVEAIQDVKK